MRRLLTLLLVLSLAACAKDDAKKDDPPQQPAKERRLTRFTFKGQEPNRKVETLPETKLVSGDGRPVGLSKWRGKPLVLVFMRGFNGNVCPYCATYTAQLAVNYEKIKAAGAELAVVYPTRPGEDDKVGEFTKVVKEILAEEGEEAIPFPVLLDPGTKVVREYNIVGDISKPSTFILDPKGKVTYAYVGRDVDDRPAIERVLKEIKGLAKE